MSKFFSMVDELDRLMVAPPTEEVVSRALTLIDDAAIRSYFFSKLQSSKWIPLLKTRGIFNTPPAPVHDKTKGTTSFPYWPEGQYLARMAKDSVQDVLDVMVAVPDTDNDGVHQELCRAALAMPPEAATQWAKKETLWIAKRSSLFLGTPEVFAELVSHLAKGNQQEAALKLAAALLAVSPDTSTEEQRRVNEFFSKPLEPRIRMDAWEYGEILKKHVSDLLAVAPNKTFALLCDLLERAVEYSTESRHHKEKFDLSFIWRPAIEEHGQNTKYDQPRDSLVEAIRDAGEKLVRDGVAQLPAIVEDFEERRKWTIFKRLALHLLRIFSDKAGDLVAARLTNHDYFEAHELRHEYALLCRDCFGHLRPEQKEIFLGWIEAITVDEEKEREAHRRFMGSEPPPGFINVESIAKIRKLNRLQPIRDSLSPEWRAKYDGWVRDIGHEPEHPEFVSYHSTGWGPTSPKPAVDLGKMSVEELVQYLKTWEPSSDRLTPTREGLSRVLTSTVEGDLMKYAAAADQFRELDPTYVRGFFYGIRGIVANQKQKVPWDKLLSLSEWVVEQDPVIPGRKAEYDADTGWGWTRKAIADLLELGLQEGIAEIPYACRKTVWRIIEPITDDPDPTVEDEARYGGDPQNYSINTTRGYAIHAAVHFGTWVRRHLEKAGQPWRGLDEIPQLRTVLNAHLEPQEHSLAIRSVYGQRFSWLAWIDESWVQANVEKIFPLSEGQRSHFDAAWEAYVVYNWPTKNGLKMLEKAYYVAIEALTLPKTEQRKFSDPEQWLASHLMLVYGRGDIDLEHGLLRDFYEKAPDAVRAEAMAFVGRSLKEEQQEALVAALPRFVQLWKWRFSAIQRTGHIEELKEELAAFGWWFASGKFEDVWAMAQLLEVLRLIKTAQPDHFVMDRLVETAATMPEQTIECLRLMIEGNKDYWKFYGWRDEMRKILGSAIQGSNHVARDAAIEVVNRLGAMGFFDYRDLLPTRSN